MERKPVYRKLGDNFDQIEPYYAAICEQTDSDPDCDERMSVAGFLRSVNESVKPTRVKQYAGNAEWYTPALTSVGRYLITYTVSIIAGRGLLPCYIVTGQVNGLHRPTASKQRLRKTLHWCRVLASIRKPVKRLTGFSVHTISSYREIKVA